MPRLPASSSRYIAVFHGTVPRSTAITCMADYDASEQDVVIETFKQMLWAATKDGGQKRAAGLKPPWYVDGAHEPAIYSHLNKWKHGEIVDKDSGHHPLVHLAWRALAIAYQETYGKRNPAQVDIPELKPRLVSKIDGTDTFAPDPSLAFKHPWDKWWDKS